MKSRALLALVLITGAMATPAVVNPTAKMARLATGAQLSLRSLSDAS